MRRVLFTALLAFAILGSLAAQDYADLAAEPHLYWQKQPKDPFTKLVAEIEAGRKRLETGDDRTVLLSLLKELGIPASSQMLVYSATSLQSGRITPNNPRALYFNEDTYVGFVPGGRLEIISMDPELGAIFYILDVPRGAVLPVVDRSKRCMNCHSGDRMNFIPGIAMESVIPSMTGATLDGFRRGKFGHGIPLEERFGGWYVTGEGNLRKHHGNLVGTLSPRGLKLDHYAAGDIFDWQHYLTRTSDVLPQLLHEHQAGFVNRVVEGTYRARYMLHQSGGKLTPTQEAILDQQAETITRYVLFAEEAALPAGGVQGDPAYKADFLSTRKALANGASLKDFDLRTRLFRYRCSYMVYTNLWDAMPEPLKTRVYARMRAALSPTRPDPKYAWMPPNEKRAIRIILKETKTGLPADWES